MGGVVNLTPKNKCQYLTKRGESCRKCGEVHEEKEICTRPSGDGSLSWPCKNHPPIERDPESAEMPQHYSAGDLDSDTFVYKRRDVVAMWKAMQGRFEPYEELIARLRRQVDELTEKLANKI